jgi:hypothetical protein
MKSYNPRSRKSHRISKPSRFDHRTAVVRKPATCAGLYLARRYRVDPAIADLLASFAGFGAELAETIGVEPDGSAK